MMIFKKQSHVLGNFKDFQNKSAQKVFVDFDCYQNKPKIC